MRFSLQPLLVVAIASGLMVGCAEQSPAQSDQAPAENVATDADVAAPTDDSAAPADSASAAAEIVNGGTAVAVADAWVRQPPAAAPVAGGYMILRNPGPHDDRLVEARTEVAADVEIHEMIMEGDVMRMRELPDGLAVPAGKTVTLKPGGLHLMLMQPRDGIVAGRRIPLTLMFERGGEQIVEFEVREVTDTKGSEDGHDHGDGGSH